MNTNDYTYINIDKLEGEALAEAVALALALEWKRGFGGFWTLPPGPDDAEGERKLIMPGYRPDLNISQAWKLLGGFVYAIDNYEWRSDMNGFPVACYLRNGSGAWLGLGNTDEEAICRAFLKTKVENDDY